MPMPDLHIVGLAFAVHRHAVTALFGAMPVAVHTVADFSYRHDRIGLFGACQFLHETMSAPEAAIYP